MKAGVFALALGVGLLTVLPALAGEPPPSAPAASPPAPTAPAASAPAPAPAAAPSNPEWLAPAAPAPSVGKTESSGGSWRSLFALLAVSGLGGAAYYMKRKRAVQVATGDAQLSVVEAVRIGPKAQIVLANVQGRLLLLGVTDNSIRRIAWAGRAATKGTTKPEAAPANDAPAPAPAPASQPKLRLSSAPRPFQAMLDALRTMPPATDDPVLQAAEATQDILERRSAAPAPAAPAPSPAAAPSAALRSLDQILEGQATGLKGRRASKRKA